jgi:maltose O-acetyltransferase
MSGIQLRLARLYQALRRQQFRWLSDCQRVEGKPHVSQPVQMLGKGTIRFNGHVHLGIFPSAFYFTGHIYLEARSPESIIEFADGVCLNNNCCLISDGPGIFIGKDSMLGTHCEVIDSDFHDLHPDRRKTGVGKTGRVVIEENVLIGSNVKILKGVRVGKNAIIANGTVLTRSVPANAIAFGNPAKVGFPLVQEEVSA